MTHMWTRKMRAIAGVVVWLSAFWAVLLIPVMQRPARAAETISDGEPKKGTLSAAQTVTYQFDGKTGQKLMIAMNAIGGDIDPFIALYNPAGRLIAEDDNGGGKLDAMLNGIVLPEDGIYQIVGSNKRKASGNYALIVTSNEASMNRKFEGETFRESFQLTKPWPRNNLTYQIKNSLPGFSAQDTRAVIAEAFGAWSAVVPLVFTESTADNADVKIEFSTIDGASNILGQACPPSSPCSGEVQFDAAEQWTLRAPQNRNAISFLAVATHEFGHIIGLLHSNDTSALMYAAYSPYNLKPGPDDIAGAQRLYSAGTGRVSPGAGSSGNAVRGRIDDSHYVTFWDFDVTAGQSVTITMKSLNGNLDSFLVLLDANNHILAYADDTEGMNAILRNIRLPKTGSYTVAATRHKQAQGYTAGDYELTIAYNQ